MHVVPIRTRLFRSGESLTDFILAQVPVLGERSVLAVTSKIVALAEGRVVKQSSIAKDELIRQEAEYAYKTEHVWLTLKEGNIIANAGVDESNAGGDYVLLPKDSFASAQQVRAVLASAYGISEFGVVITDSRTTPLRAGVTAVALGWAGFEGVKSYVGEHDLFGRTFAYERVNVADSLATSAALVMGEGSESQPLCSITEAPVVYTHRHIQKDEARIVPEDDMYVPFLEVFKKRL